MQVATSHAKDKVVLVQLDVRSIGDLNIEQMSAYRQEDKARMVQSECWHP